MSMMSDHQRTPLLTRIWDSNMAYSFRRNPVAIVSMLIFLVIVMAAILAPLIAPTNPVSYTHLTLPTICSV